MARTFKQQCSRQDRPCLWNGRHKLLSQPKHGLSASRGRLFSVCKLKRECRVHDHSTDTRGPRQEADSSKHITAISGPFSIQMSKFSVQLFSWFFSLRLMYPGNIKENSFHSLFHYFSISCVVGIISCKERFFNWLWITQAPQASLAAYSLEQEAHWMKKNRQAVKVNL